MHPLVYVHGAIGALLAAFSVVVLRIGVGGADAPTALWTLMIGTVGAAVLHMLAGVWQATRRTMWPFGPPAWVITVMLLGGAAYLGFAAPAEPALVVPGEPPSVAP